MSNNQERIYGVTSKGDGMVTELRENNGVLEYKNKLGQYVPVSSAAGGRDSSEPVVAHSDDGISYYVTLDPAPEELYIGMHLTIIPDVYSNSQRAKLYVNDLGPYEFSMQTYIMGTYGKPASSYFLQANCPVNIIFGPARNNNYSYWWIEDYSKPYWNDIGYKPDWLTPIDNLDAASSGTGLLDAHQGKVLKDMINVTSLTYAELVSLRDSNGLIPGHYYSITDYCTYYLYDGNTKTTNVTEKLQVCAISNSRLHNVAYSSTYPEDIIYYDIDNDDSKYEWAVPTGRGVIYRRIDTLRNIDVCYDWRTIIFKRYKISADNIPVSGYVPVSYNPYDLVVNSNSLYICYKTTSGTVGSGVTNSSSFIKLISDITKPISCISGLPCGDNKRIPVSSGTGSYTWYKSFCGNIRNIKVTAGSYPIKLPDLVFMDNASDVYLSNASNATFCSTVDRLTVNNLEDSIFLGSCENNSCEYIRNSIIAGTFEDNSMIGIKYSIIGDNFGYNKINIIGKSMVGNNCYVNNINIIDSSRIGDNCYANNCQNVYFYYSLFGSHFCGNSSYGGDDGDVTITVNDMFRNNIFPGNINIDMSNYQYLHKSGNDITGKYGGYMITGCEFNNNSLGPEYASKMVASKVMKDGSLFTFEIV